MCKRMICAKCKECKRHDVITIGNLLEKHKDDMASSRMEELGRKIEMALEGVEAKIKRYETDTEKYGERIKMKREMIAHSKEGEDRDRALIEETMSYIREVQLKAFTDILREKCQEEIDILEIQEQIHKEIEGYSEEMERLKTVSCRVEKLLEEMRRERGWLEEASKARKNRMDEKNDKLALSICLEDGMLERNRVCCSVQEFQVMENVEDMFDVYSVMERKLVDIGEGIKISEPLVVEMGLRTVGMYFIASLSHQGILAIYSATKDINNGYTYKQGDKVNIIQFTNLRNGEQVEVEVEDFSSIAFYDDRMILLTWNKPLMEANMEDVFRVQNTSIFKKVVDVEDVYLDTDTSLLRSRRVLCYR